MPDHVDPPPSASFIGPGSEVHPGFGRVVLARNGVGLVSDVTGEKNIDYYTKWVKRQARPHEATGVWTLHIDAPLSSQIYAYTPDGYWTLIDTKDGFA